MFAPHIKRTHLLTICIAICAGYFVFGLWPFKTRFRNNLGWRPSADGTFFGWQSGVYSERDLDLSKIATPSEQAGSVSIELYLKSYHEATGEIGSILSLYDRDLPANLLIAQRRTDLLLRTAARNSHGRRTYHEVRVGARLDQGIQRFVAISSGAGGTDFYVDGKLIESFPELVLPPEVLRGRLVIGDAPEGKSHWAGKLAGIAIFGRSLDAQEVDRHYRLWTGKQPQDFRAEPGLSALYRLGERDGRTIPDHSASGNPLLIPEYYRAFRKTVLIPPWRDPRFPDSGDIVMNILGFIPFGLFYFFYRARIRPRSRFRNLGLTIVTSGFISMTIELIQAFLPNRFSSLTDVLCNTAGGLAGALLAASAIYFAAMRTERRTLSQ